MATSNALANAPKSVRDEASALARKTGSSVKKKLMTAQKVKTPVIATVAGTALGVAERFAPDVQIPGIDNGVTLGLAGVIAGAFMPGKLGEALMLAGSGWLASGARNMARTVGADDDDAPGETEGI
jgi:hypothetical protein